MTYLYTIGGAAFSTSEPLPDLETDGPADIECTVLFADMEEFRVAVATGALPVTGPGSLVGAVDIDDRRCRILDEASDPADRAWRLRQLAPIFSSILGKLVLHASAVAVDGSAVGFIGATGVGKSTLGKHLSDAGYPAISDDLLPVRSAPEPAALTRNGLLPFGALCFLTRSEETPVSLVPIDAADALKAHISNGFGEHRHPDTWAAQFDGYHRLVEAVSHYDLVLPDDLAALPVVAAAVLDVITHGSPSESDGL